MDEIKVIREFIELAYGNYIGLHKSKIDLLTLLKEKEQDINYTRCCTTLKKQETPNFEEYLKLLGWEQISSSYVYKQGRNYRDIEDLRKEYNKKYNL